MSTNNLYHVSDQFVAKLDKKYYALIKQNNRSAILEKITPIKSEIESGILPFKYSIDIANFQKAELEGKIGKEYIWLGQTHVNGRITINFGDKFVCSSVYPNGRVSIRRLQVYDTEQEQYWFNDKTKLELKESNVPCLFNNEKTGETQLWAVGIASDAIKETEEVDIKNILLNFSDETDSETFVISSKHLIMLKEKIAAVQQFEQFNKNLPEHVNKNSNRYLDEIHKEIGELLTHLMSK